MLTRRHFLAGTATLTTSLLTASAFARVFQPAGGNDAMAHFKGNEVFERILKKAQDEKWAALPIGQCMAKIAHELAGTPYVAFTLELSADNEFCSVNLEGLDCVTFFEGTLDFARMLKKGGSTPEDLVKEVTYTRYRGGKVTDFTSRLHYTTDWYYDNEAKGVVKLLAPELPGSEPFTQKVGIMSAKPSNYRQLKAHPELVPTIAAQEAAINERNPRIMKYVPLGALPEAEKKLQSGDLVGICTTAAGIDISHTGLVMVDDSGVAHFMDASSSKSKMKVTFEKGPLHEDITSRNVTGAMFARPLEPK